MSGTAPHDRPLPWIMGLLIIVVAIGTAAWLTFVSTCGAPVATITLVPLVMPAACLPLMYLRLSLQT